MGVLTVSRLRWCHMRPSSYRWWRRHLPPPCRKLVRCCRREAAARGSQFKTETQGVLVHYRVGLTRCSMHDTPQLHCTLHSSNGGLYFGREVASPLGGHRHASGARGRLRSDVIGRGGARQGEKHSLRGLIRGGC